MFTLSLRLLEGKKRNANSIFVLNLLAGWTFVGWVVAMVWAVSKDDPDPNDEFKEIRKDDRLDRLAKLKDLFDSKVLTEEEYGKEKQKILNE